MGLRHLQAQTVAEDDLWIFYTWTYTPKEIFNILLVLTHFTKLHRMSAEILRDLQKKKNLFTLRTLSGP